MSGPDVLRIDRGLAVGFARAKITDGWKHPRAGSESPDYTVHDDLWATALVVCEGAKPAAALVSLDLGVITKPPCDELRGVVADATGVAFDRVALHTTHTHASYSGHDVDPAWLGARIAEAINDAAKHAAPASVAHASRDLGAGYVFNRRVRLSDGLGAHCVMFNDDCRTENGRVEASGQLRKVVAGWEAKWDDLEMSKRETWTDGPIDSHLHVVSFRDASGRTLGSVVRFCGHPVIVSRHWIGNELSRDAVGYVADAVAAETGASCLYLTGPSGNQRLYCEAYTHDEASRRGGRIAAEALKLVDTLAFSRFERFALATTQVPLDLWDGFPKTPEDQERKLAEAEAAVKAALAAKRSPSELKRLAEQRIRVHHVRQMFDRPLLTPDEARAGRFQQPVTAWDFGPARILTFPCEPFREISEDVCAGAGPDVMTVQLTNGSHGYVPTADEWKLGGYETTWCSTASDAAERYVAAASALLQTVVRP
ncbi:MAG TPA: hypothetical protein VMX57_07570 [Planctomycetota bacterium]|nr:hypothetical protein [Planctomycetota bacterium]